MIVTRGAGNLNVRKAKMTDITGHVNGQKYQ